MLADDLLSQAQHLATVDPRKPKQASLRRAVSAAYYALFHLLVADCIRRVAPRTPPGLDVRIARSLAHSEMKQVCRSISAGSPSEVLQGLQPGGFSAPLRSVAKLFVVMQEARHRADYDLAETYTRTDTLKLLEQVHVAFRSWKSVRSRDEANVFLAALLFSNRWSKG